MSAELNGGGFEEEAEEEEGEGVAWDGEAVEEVEGEEEDGIRRETERERRQRRRQISKDTLKQLCAYSGLHVMSNMQKTTEPKAREQVSTMYQCGLCRTGKYIDHTKHMMRI